LSTIFIDQVLLRTEYLSLDPYMRGRMSDAPSYLEPVKVGGTVCRVEASRHTDYKAKAWVLAYSGWQAYALSDDAGLTRLGQNPQHAFYALGILGMPGFTPYTGLLDIGRPKPGETLVVAAATGPAGPLVGGTCLQIRKNAGQGFSAGKRLANPS
jgi:NADPH-dependent curcumin reductase